MSKDKPEVGDVWRSIKLTKHILATSKNAVRFLVVGDWGKQPKIMVKTIDEFMEINKYLGKSKAKIADLFKTENE